MAESDKQAFQPLDLPGLLFETVHLYRRSVLAFLTIALAAQAPALVYIFSQNRTTEILLMVFSVAIGALAQGAAAYAVACLYLRHPISVVFCYAQAFGKGHMLIIGTFLVVGVLLICGFLSLVLLGIPLLFYFLVSWSFIVPVMMLEKLDPLSALGRSRRLVQGSWWRVFGIGIVFVLLLFSMLMVVTSVSAIIALISYHLANLFISLVLVAMAPVIYIGTVLVYLDLRVRKEGYTQEQLREELET